MTNPLQQYFRQPKLFVKLPSGGLFNKIGTLSGDVSNAPVYGMTGMDEIIMKTPDALMSGESTAAVIASCCPVVKDAWELSALDVPVLLAAIRIATYGADLSVTNICTKCGHESDYDVDLTNLLAFYDACTFENTVKIGSMTFKLQPLTYKQTTELAIRNFKIQQRLSQAEQLTDVEQQATIIKQLFAELGELQEDVYINSVESIETPTGIVTDRNYILEFMANCDADVFSAIKKCNESIRSTWTPPPTKLCCDACGAESEVVVELDQANFFVKA